MRLSLVNVVRVVFLLVLVVWFLFPVVWGFLTSIKTEADAFTYPPVFLFVPTLSAWSYILTNAAWLGYFLHSLTATLVATGLALLLGVPAAYALASYPVSGKEGILFSFLSLRFIPPIILLMPYFLIFSDIGLLGSIGSLILVYVVIGLPFVIWIMHSYFLGIPKELKDAAAVDGASMFQTLRRVILPVAAPGLMVTALICMIFMWNEFPFAFILTNKTSETVVPALTAEGITYFGLRYNVIGALGILTIIPMIVIALYAQRYLVKGLTMGIVRGGG